MQLSEIEIRFECEVYRDGEFKYTLHPGSDTPGTLCYAFGGKYLQLAVENIAVSCIITTKDNAYKVPANKGVLVAENPQVLYYNIHNYLVLERKSFLVEESYISSSATIHSSVEIKGNVIVEDDVVIEKDVIIEPNTIIRKGSYIGNRVILGAKGMQNFHANNELVKVLYAGGVEIGQQVEILDMSIIQRPYNFFFTKLGSKSKISVRVNIGHGCVIGDNCMIAGSAQISGNVTIANQVWIGPSVTIADALFIGEKAKILIGSVVVNNIPGETVVSGNFALDHIKQLKNYSRIKKI